jgi:hypothetical protein
MVSGYIVAAIVTARKLIQGKMFQKHLEGHEATDEQVSLLQNFIEQQGWKHNYTKRICTFMRFDTGECFIVRFSRLSSIGSSSITLERLTVLYGKEEGERRWQQYREKQSFSNTLVYKAQRHGWDEEQFKQYNRSRSQTLANMISRYGEDEGLRKWEDYCERQKYTNALAYFIEREGDEQRGKDAWVTYNHSKGGSRRPPDIAKRLGIGIAEAEAICADRFASNLFVSNKEMKFVERLEALVGPIPFSHKTKQWCIWSSELNSPLFYDVACYERKKIIEYNGDYWHANPSIYDPSWICCNGMTAREIWHRDQVKKDLAIHRGFDYRVVWESEQPDFGEIEAWWND